MKMGINWIGIALILFGIIVIRNPDLLAVLIGIFFVFVGGNILLLRYFFHPKGESFKFGDYEIFKNKKK